MSGGADRRGVDLGGNEEGSAVGAKPERESEEINTS